MSVVTDSNNNDDNDNNHYDCVTMFTVMWSVVVNYNGKSHTLFSIHSVNAGDGRHREGRAK